MMDRFVLLLAAALALAALGARGIWESDEGRYTAAGARMADTGDWRTPRLDLDRPHLTKPPLTYWSVAASTTLFGRNELAARLPNALAFVLSVLLLLRLGPAFAPERPWLPGLIYATAPVTVLGASVVTTDTLLALFELAAVWCWWRARQEGRRWIVAMWLMLGLGFLTKGPPALLPLLAIVAFHAIRKERAQLASLWHPLGLAGFVVVGGAWFAAMVAREPSLAGYFVGHEFIDRIATDVHDRNPEWYAPFTLYLPVLLAGLLPWPLALGRRALAGLALHRARWWTEAPAERLALALWFLLPLAVFCFARSRQVAYLLPLFAPLALMLGRALAPRFDPAALGARALLAIAVALTLALKLWLGQWQHYKDTRALRDELGQQLGLVATDRVLFVERWPQWGLRFYLPLTIGHLESIDEACGALAPTGRTVLITTAPRAAALADALAACGATPKLLPQPYYDARILTAVR